MPVSRGRGQPKAHRQSAQEIYGCVSWSPWRSSGGGGRPKPSGTTHSARITVSRPHDGCVDAIRKSVIPDKSGKSRVQPHDVGEAAAEHDHIGVQEVNHNRKAP